jgi:hypothetical protein
VRHAEWLWSGRDSCGAANSARVPLRASTTSDAGAAASSNCATAAHTAELRKAWGLTWVVQLPVALWMEGLAILGHREGGMAAVQANRLPTPCTPAKGGVLIHGGKAVSGATCD